MIIFQEIIIWIKFARAGPIKRTIGPLKVSLANNGTLLIPMLWLKITGERERVNILEEEQSETLD